MQSETVTIKAAFCLLGHQNTITRKLNTALLEMLSHLQTCLAHQDHIVYLLGLYRAIEPLKLTCCRVVSIRLSVSLFICATVVLCCSASLSYSSRSSLPCLQLASWQHLKCSSVTVLIAGSSSLACSFRYWRSCQRSPSEPISAARIADQLKLFASRMYVRYC